MSSCVQAELVCFEASCRERFAITEVLYNCPKCGGLIEATYRGPRPRAAELRDLFRQRRLSNAPIDTSGVWRYRELFYILAWRDVSVRYKQTVIGVAWALIQPLLTMVVMTVVFGMVAKGAADTVDDKDSASQ